MSKTGADHLKSLDDGREVFINGALVDDPVNHPAFRNSVRSAAALYDFQAENLDLMTYESPTSGKPVNLAWLLPKSYEDLVRRREAITAWSRQTYGFMGRSPDHIASSLVGQVMGLPLFEEHNPKCARAIWNYYEYARDNDVYLTYVIINPQADRSKDTGDQEDEFLTTAIVDEDSEGITVRGAKMLGTSSIMANDVLVANIQPLVEGEEKYAISFAIGLGTKGVKIMSRKSYEEHAVSQFDNPLSSQFDENDALIFFDDVKVPWDRIFVYRGLDMCRAQFQDTWAHSSQNYQCQIRLMVKMRFMMGLILKVCETNGVTAFPAVRDQLGRLAAQAAMVDGMVHGIEAAGENYNGYFAPNRHLVYAAQSMTQEMYPQMVNVMRELSGGGLIMLPSSAADFANPELADLIHRTQKSSATDPEGRVKLMKLAWDALGSEFASRHVQYEMFYAGAQFVTRGHMYRTYPWEDATGMVDELLASYDLKDSMITRPKSQAAE